MSLISSLSVSRGINHNKHETIVELFHSIHYFHSNMFNFNSKMFDFNKLLDFLCLWMLLTTSVASTRIRSSSLFNIHV